MPVLQTHIPYSPWSDPRLMKLPGMQPVAPDNWLIVDEAFAGQMELRDTLLADRCDAVLAMTPVAEQAAQELLQHVVNALSPEAGYQVQADAVTRPDGTVVILDESDPLTTVGRLVQEDFCLMCRVGDAYILGAAVLCFPSSWTLSEKIGRPLTAIHVPVPEYDEALAARVERLFDGIRPEQPLWRANLNFYADPTLHAPCSESAPRPAVPHPAPFVRSERQSLLRLPESGAVVFAIHTYMMRYSGLSKDDQDQIRRYRST